MEKGCVCMCVPVEVDKALVTDSTEVRLAISCRQPCLPCGWFNQTSNELTSHPAGLSSVSCHCPQLTLDQQARIYIMYVGIRGVAFMPEADIRSGLKGLEIYCISHQGHFL